MDGRKSTTKPAAVIAVETTARATGWRSGGVVGRIGWDMATRSFVWSMPRRMAVLPGHSFTGGPDH